MNEWCGLLDKSLGMQFHSLEHLWTEWRCFLTDLYKPMGSILLSNIVLCDNYDILLCIDDLW